MDLPRPLRLVAPPSCASQVEYISYFSDALAVMQTEAALERTAYELCLDSAADGVEYLEVRWAPRLHLVRGLSVGQVIEAVLRGLAAGPIRVVAIVCAMRTHSSEANLALAREAARFLGRGVVGFDLAGDEAGFPSVEPHRPAFELAGAAGLGLTCHAGEAGPAANVTEALGLGVTRIGHGVIGAGEPALIERVRSDGVVLDLCPTANWKCKAVDELAAHPLPRLVRAGVRCTVSTDSRTVAGTTLSREYELCATVMGMTEDELRTCARNAHDARFDR